ncbi:MAG: leucine-rich repeat protein, partial [Lachnospiraceae bacterium]|nr:leucine-rich repeat protein [Lachnospiraceae bacterium]
ESEEQSTEEEKTYSVVFHMNGGGFTGIYQDKKYDNAPSLKLELSCKVDIDESIYPGKSSSVKYIYEGYKTDNKWYLDKNCLEEFGTGRKEKTNTTSIDDVTLYKKWYHTTSWNGTTESEKGFVLNPIGTVLYKYTGNDTNITIPACVTVIGNNAFTDLNSVKSIKLPAGLQKVGKNSFSGISAVKTDIEIYGESSQSQKIADNLINQYTHFVVKKSTDTSDNSNSNENSEKTNSTDVTTENKSTTKTDNNVVEIANNGSIKLGVQGYREKYVLDGTISNVINKDNLTSIPLGTVALAKSISPISNVPADNDIQSSNTTSVVSQPAFAKETAVSAEKLTASAGTVHSARHIKDATPKTGDPIQYRMIFVCIMFSAGALLLLTGNGYKKKCVAFSQHHRK